MGRNVIPAGLLAAAAAMALPGPAPAQVTGCPAGDTVCAENLPVAREINDEIDNGRLRELWARNVSTFMKNAGGEDIFLASFAPLSAVLSIGVQRRTIIVQGMNVDPISNKRFYGRTYKVTLNNGKDWYENMALLKEGDKWLLSGLALYPAPIQ